MAPFAVFAPRGATAVLVLVNFASRRPIDCREQTPVQHLFNKARMLDTKPPGGFSPSPWNPQNTHAPTTNWYLGHIIHTLGLLCIMHGISVITLYTERKKYIGLTLNRCKPAYVFKHWIHGFQIK